jgi:hypothetical protein
VWEALRPDRRPAAPEGAVSDVLAQIERAEEMVSALCKPRGTPGAREWIMLIPARPDHDPDLVIGEALAAAKKEIERLKEYANWPLTALACCLVAWEDGKPLPAAVQELPKHWARLVRSVDAKRIIPTPKEPMPEQPSETPKQEAPEHILQFFAYRHLPPHLAEVSEPFHDQAHRIVRTIPRNPERTVALRKLLESKDAAVRAAVAS